MRSILSRLKSLPKAINVSIIGTGSTGKGIFYQTHITPGIECVAIADIEIQKAIDCAEFMHRDYTVVETVTSLDEAIRQNRLALCEDGELICQSEMVEILIEASSSIVKGGEFASNWELSAARAVTVVKFLERAGVSASRLSAAGYAHLRPTADNSTEEGRAANRRIEIILMPNLDELPDLSSLADELGEN